MVKASGVLGSRGEDLMSNPVRAQREEVRFGQTLKGNKELFFKTVGRWVGKSFPIVETPLNKRERWGEGKRGRACTSECI